MLTKDKSAVQDFKEAIELEWLETNGLGGWSSSSVAGALTRRYHGLLVAAVVPPAERMVLVSKLDETIILGNERYELGANDYGDTIHPRGYQYLTGFAKDLFPEFTYQAGEVRLQKTIAMIHGENTVVVIYTVIRAGQPFTLELLPLLAGRDYHRVLAANDAINSHSSFETDIFQTKPYADCPAIFIKVPAGVYHPAPEWFYQFNYRVEKYRGLDFKEDLFSPGKFTVELHQGALLGIILSTDNPVSKDAHHLFGLEKERRQALLHNQPPDELVRQLVLAADQFIVKRSISFPTGKTLEGATIIAGYHWFTDWGRDTMISLPGLCLATGRYEDAKKILIAFAHSVSEGMLPNRFRDDGQEPEYNNADGTLWYFIAIYKYLQATNNRDFVIAEILPLLKDIIERHFRGTRYNIHVEEDGLLYAGEKGQQLTWMDAKIGDWVVTPRMGSPVEIQALWYNALKIFSELLQADDQHPAASLIESSAEKARKTFGEKFWYAEGNYLYDVIDENGIPDASLRPNQLFAISLPFALIEGPRASAVLQVVKEQLYTPVGLRSLAQNDPHYVQNYGGDAYSRDASYHQGTVWSWLLGAYVDAMMKVKVEKSTIKKVIEDFAYHLQEGCIGSVSEIFDADAPYHQRGCVAQAWGVAEILRVIKEYGLFGDHWDQAIS